MMPGLTLRPSLLLCEDQATVGLFRVPVLISTGERDGYLNCCLIRTVRKNPLRGYAGRGSGHARGASYRALDGADA